MLINGAAGGVGTLAVQIAKWLGAEVTAVCSTRNVDLVRSIGADRFVDYTREDFTKAGRRYDAIFDLVADHSFTRIMHVLRPNATYVGAGILGCTSMTSVVSRLVRARLLSPFVNRKIVRLLARRCKQDLIVMCDLMKSGKVTPVIDRCYPMSQAADAIRYLEENHARGKIVILVGEPAR